MVSTIIKIRYRPIFFTNFFLISNISTTLYNHAVTEPIFSILPISFLLSIKNKSVNHFNSN